MQLKGLVRFFTILLIVISLYQLSFTWVVNNHEEKMEKLAKEYVAKNFPNPESKYPSNSTVQSLYRDTLDRIFKNRLARLLDSTKNQTVTYGVQGAISYQKAKESELNLGLDLQGGMNVTMEVGLEGLLRSMSANSKDPNFNKAIDLASERRKSSDKDFISLFTEEYKKLVPQGKLSAIFANPNNQSIKPNASDDEVLRVIRAEATSAIDRTYEVLSTRIDKFGVAQPNMIKDVNKGIISVELAGVMDPDRVRRFLQSSANLQFWEVYNIMELDASLMNAEKSLSSFLKGSSGEPEPDSTSTSSNENSNQKNEDSTGKNLSELLGKSAGANSGAAAGDSASKAMEAMRLERPLSSIVQFIPPQDANQDGQPEFSSALGYIATVDTAIFNGYISNPVVKNQFPANLKFLFGKPEKDKNGVEQAFLPVYAIKTVPGSDKAKLEGEHVIDARQDFEQNNEVTVNMSMNKVGTKIWAQMTEKNRGRAIAIVLDDIVYSAPNVNEPIPNGNSRISGNFSIEEAQDLANILKAGKLPTPAKIVQEQLVGPTLGQEAIEGGALAFALSFLVIFILMLVYFNTSGWVANIALVFNLLFTIGVLSAMGATLTAPGIAGLVLTIGMAVDTNVLIFERIKEELGRGKNYQIAVADGYRRSLAPVLDGHITTLLTAIILFKFGVGPVLGFATTQILGILLSLFCGILLSRLITDIWTKKDRHFKYFTNLSNNLLKNVNINFTSMRKTTYVISGIIVILGISSFFVGFDQGVEFAGGRNYKVRFEQVVSPDEVRQALEKSFGEAPIVKTVGGNTQLDITTSYLITSNNEDADQQVQMKLFEGLKTFLPAGVDYQKFDTEYKLGSMKVEPSISADLKSGAKWATFWSLLVIGLYIFIRFRDVKYSIGTIVALLHDVLVVLIVFSLLRKVVPFPLEIDQHFIAAILTVIGFSMNDTVVVFDRIRENTGLMKNASQADVINRSINETLSRTIMTSLTVFLTLLILFIVGGEVTRGFAFAMLIGVITGVYSSIFVAAPILLDLGKKKTSPAKESTPETAKA